MLQPFGQQERRPVIADGLRPWMRLIVSAVRGGMSPVEAARHHKVSKDSLDKYILTTPAFKAAIERAQKR